MLRASGCSRRGAPRQITGDSYGARPPLRQSTSSRRSARKLYAGAEGWPAVRKRKMRYYERSLVIDLAGTIGLSRTDPAVLADHAIVATALRSHSRIHASYHVPAD